MGTIILLFVYTFLGDKANQFCKRHILRLETVYVYNIGGWLLKRAFWGFSIGWITIPIACIMWLCGVRNK